MVLSVRMSYAVLAVAVLACGLAGWLVLLSIRMSRLKRQYARLMSGADGLNLEEVVNGYIDRMDEALSTVSALETRVARMERTLSHCLQWVGMVRFSPFRDTAGAQSFALAIIDGSGDGVVLSGLHSRDSTRVYAKALTKWGSQHTLTDEEREAISRAQQLQAY
jgi:Protein of unknown function (DUF4446)